jgi:hypothetical protein
VAVKEVEGARYLAEMDLARYMVADYERALEEVVVVANFQYQRQVRL